MNALSHKLLLRKEVGSVKIAYRESGQGEPMIMIHGSWDDHHSWDGVVGILSEHFRVITFDRRGHGSSTDEFGQGSIKQDVFDVTGLMNTLGIGSAHIVGHSYGANIAIALCENAPTKIKSVFVHEPPIFSLLSDEVLLDDMRLKYLSVMKRVAQYIEDGAVERAAILFIEEVAFGEGSWASLFDECARRSILSNVDTWLDQYYDPDRLAVDITSLDKIGGRVAISTGSASLPPYEIVVKRIVSMIPKANLVRIDGAGHGAHISHPRQIAKEILVHLKQ